MSDRVKASARRAREVALASRERASERANLRRARRTQLEQWRAVVETEIPYVGLIRAPAVARPVAPLGHTLTVASYNVHRFSGLTGRAPTDPARAVFVLSELGADIVALQEVLRPFDRDPLPAIGDALHMHIAFVATRVHRRGEIGNAMLSRWPFQSVEALDLSFSRLEQRGALAARFRCARGALGVIATHLALVDGTRSRQVASLLNHPHFDSGAVVLMGDMNAWRRDKATRALDRELRAHDNQAWPASFPAARPVLALDRIYARGAEVLSLRAHESPAARRASDHLPIAARVEIGPPVGSG